MNEQIKKIALECYNPYSSFDINKFAELMVEECANIADQYTRDGDWDIAKIIKRHFGVEE